MRFDGVRITVKLNNKSKLELELFLTNRSEQMFWLEPYKVNLTAALKTACRLFDHFAKRSLK